jgi:hypothetical protein
MTVNGSTVDPIPNTDGPLSKGDDTGGAFAPTTDIEEDILVVKTEEEEMMVEDDH